MSNKKIKNMKIDREKEKREKLQISHRLAGIGICTAAVFSVLIFRIGYIQFVNGSEYKESAYKQQTINRIISPKRGTIYDATGKSLAISANVDTITINPKLIVVKDSDPEVAEIKTNARKEKVAQAFADIFGLDYDTMLEKVNSSASLETIIKKVEQNKVDELKNWMEKNEIYGGINIDNDTKRYYPYNNLASNLIGFCGDDNQGLEGLEASLDKLLTGTPGKIVTSADSWQKEIRDENQTYIVAENGSDVILSIDYNIQSIAEKYLKQAVEENKCGSGGNIVIMKPDTGDILAMATYPDYNLNTPFSPASEDAQEQWSEMSSNDRANYLYSLWRNIAVTNGYEPGSTFKIITSAIAMEEGIITDIDDNSQFLCTGVQKVSSDTDIRCWRYSNPHGYESLRQALCNSCNPAFIQLGQRIGTRTFYKYLDAFGLRSTSSSAFLGEFSGLFHNEANVGPTELATLTFGQRFMVSPLQLITAVSSIANDGVLMKPRIVKQIINSNTGSITSIEPEEIRAVLSKETCDKLKSMLESVVTVGTGRYAAVDGYSIGGKTGTSEPSPSNPDYVASYIAISPTTDTQVVVLVTLYDPHGASHEGGQIAAPVIAQVMSELLPYLGFVPDTDGNNDEQYNTVTDVRNKTLTEAVKVLEKSGFTVKYNNTEDNNSILVSDQNPKPGTKLLDNSIVALYTEDNSSRTSVKVPDLKGKTLAGAKETLRTRNLNIVYEGRGRVISQDIIADSSVEIGTVVKVTLKEYIADTH